MIDNVFGTADTYANPLMPVNPNQFGHDPNWISLQARMGLMPQYAPFSSMQGPGSNVGMPPASDTVGMLGMMAAPFLQQMGYTPTNLLGAPPGFAQAIRNRYEWNQISQAGALSAQRGDSVDTQRYNSIGRSLALMAGPDDKYADEYGRALNNAVNNPLTMTMAATIGGMTGIDLVGQMYPGRTTAMAVARMGMGMYRGGGEFGLSPTEAADLGGQISGEFYKGGFNQFEKTRGFSADNSGT